MTKKVLTMGITLALAWSASGAVKAEPIGQMYVNEPAVTTTASAGLIRYETQPQTASAEDGAKTAPSEQPTKVHAVLTPVRDVADTVEEKEVLRSISLGPSVSERKGQILRMPDVAAMFLERYPRAAIGVIELDTKYLGFKYMIKGYTPTSTETMYIDSVTGMITKTENSGRNGKFLEKIFNPQDVISVDKAGELAVKQISEQAYTVAWRLYGEKNRVFYKVTVRDGLKEYKITLDAKTGEFIEKSGPRILPPPEED